MILTPKKIFQATPQAKQHAHKTLRHTKNHAVGKQTRAQNANSESKAEMVETGKKKNTYSSLFGYFSV